MPIARSKPPVPPNTSLLFGHNATALLPHRASYRRNIRLRIGQRAYSDTLLGACRSMPIACSKPPVRPNTSLLFGHNATALLPHRASYRRNIRLRIGQRAYSDRLLEVSDGAR